MKPLHLTDSDGDGIGATASAPDLAASGVPGAVVVVSTHENGDWTGAALTAPQVRELIDWFSAIVEDGPAVTATGVRPPSELLDEIREDLRYEGTPRCDRWFPEIEEGAPVLSLNLSVGLAWWVVALPIVEKVRHGDRVLVLASPEPAAVGRVGTVAVREGWTFVDLKDGTDRFPMLRSAALLPAEATS